VRGQPVLPIPPKDYSPSWGGQLSEAITRALIDAHNQTIDRIYPVGSIYANDTDSRDPAIIIGRGTWTAHSVSWATYGWKRTA